MFEAKYPWITVKHVGGKSPQDILRAINSGTAPDVAIEAGPDNVGEVLQHRRMRRPEPVPSRPTRSTSPRSFRRRRCGTPATRASSARCRCSPTPTASTTTPRCSPTPGITSPPKTLLGARGRREEADRLQLGRLDQGRRLRAAAATSTSRHSLSNGVWNGAQWYDSSGKSAFATDPKWAELLDVAEVSSSTRSATTSCSSSSRRSAAPNSEWNAQQAFKKGKVAMTLDGEWRTRSSTTTSRTCTTRRRRSRWPTTRATGYGLGPDRRRRHRHPARAASTAEAWLLVKYLAPDTQAEVKLCRAR